jgi:hypothetical protein
MLPRSEARARRVERPGASSGRSRPGERRRKRPRRSLIVGVIAASLFLQLGASRRGSARPRNFYEMICAASGPRRRRSHHKRLFLWTEPTQALRRPPAPSGKYKLKRPRGVAALRRIAPFALDVELPRALFLLRAVHARE